MENLSQYLDNRRGRAAELARSAGVSVGTISSLRNGQRRASSDLAKKIERATGGIVTAASLLGVDGAAPRSAKPLGDGRWSVAATEAGALLPSEMLVALGFDPRDVLVFRREGDRTVVSSQKAAFARVRARASGQSVVDELIADRRAEAAGEADASSK